MTSVDEVSRPRISIEKSKVSKAYDEAIRLLELKEQRKVIELPFAVGETVYKLEKSQDGRKYITKPEFIVSLTQAVNIAFTEPNVYFSTLEEVYDYFSCYLESETEAPIEH